MNDIFVVEQQPQPQVIGKTFGNRAWAYIIDSIIYVLVNLGVSFVTGVVIGVALSLSGREFQVADEQTLQCISQIIGLFLFAFYFAVFEWLYGATLGKLVLGMRVVMENGEPCSFGGALIRAFLRYIDGFFFGIPAYTSMKHPLHQRIGDKAAKTIVLDAKSTFIKQPRNWWQFLIATGIYLALNTGAAVLSVVLSIR